MACAAKEMGIAVKVNDATAFPFLRLKTSVENDRIALGEKASRIVSALNYGRGRTIKGWYGNALATGNAALLDGLAANLCPLDGITKQVVAVCLTSLRSTRRTGLHRPQSQPLGNVPRREDNGERPHGLPRDGVRP